MEVKTLQEVAAEKTQLQIAQKIGVNQSAVSQMLRSERRILVLVNSLGGIDRVWEERDIGSATQGGRGAVAEIASA